MCVNACVCVCAYVYTCVRLDYKRTTRSHAYTLTPECVVMSQSKHCITSPFLMQHSLRTQHTSDKKHWWKKDGEKKVKKLSLLP